MSTTKPKRTTAFWRTVVGGCSSFDEKISAIRARGLSTGRAILLARKHSTPKEFSHWQRVERPFLHEQKLRRRALAREA